MADDTNGPINLMDFANDRTDDGRLPSINETIAQVNRDPMAAAYPTAPGGAAGGPSVPTAPAAPAGQTGVGDIGSALGNILGQAGKGAGVAAAGGKPGKKPISAEEVSQNLLEQLSKLSGNMDQLAEGKGKWGADILDKTIGEMGITPGKAALFALGALMTRKAPTATAWNVTMKLMNMPEEYQKAKQQALLNEIGKLSAGANAASLLAQRQQKVKDDAFNQAMMQRLMAGQGGATGAPPTGGPAADTSGATGPQLTPISTEGVSAEALGEMGGPQLINALSQGVQPVATGPDTMMVGPTEYQMSMSGGRMSLKAVGQRLTPEGIMQLAGGHISEADALGISKLPPSRYHEAISNTITKNRVPSAEAIKIYADTGIKSEGVPDGMTREQAAASVKAEQDRAVAVAGARASAVATGQLTAKEAAPGSATAAGMVRYNPQTDKFEFADSQASVAQARGQGYVMLKGAGAAQVAQAMQKDEPTRRSFAQIKAAGMIAVKDVTKATQGMYSGGRMGGDVGKAAALYDADKKQFAEIFDGYWGGVRGASSPTMAALMASRLPQIGIGLHGLGDTPDLATTKFQSIQNILDGLRSELIAKAGGKSTTNQEAKTNQAISDYLGISLDEFNRLSSLDSGTAPASAPATSAAPQSTTTPPPFKR